MWLMKVMRQGSELHGLAIYINKYNWLCVFWGALGKENPALRPGGVLLLVHLADCSIRSISQSKNRLVDQSVVL